MDPANLPYSAAKGDRPGCDVELAQALAGELNVKLQIDWIDIQRETAIGQLLDGECDLAFGAAIEPRAVDDEEEIADRVIYSRPYYGTGYRAGDAKEWAQREVARGVEGRKIATHRHRGRIGGRLPTAPARLSETAVSHSTVGFESRCTTAESTMPICGPMSAGRCTPHPTLAVELVRTVTCRKITGTSPSPCAAATMN